MASSDKFLEKYVLSSWPSFSIWSAGKQGRKLFRDLTPTSRSKVQSFGDVNRKKIGTVYENQLSEQVPKPKIPIVHFSQLEAPFLVAVKVTFAKKYQKLKFDFRPICTRVA